MSRRQRIQLLKGRIAFLQIHKIDSGGLARSVGTLGPGVRADMLQSGHGMVVCLPAEVA